MAVSIPTDPANLLRLVLSLALVGGVVLIASKAVGYSMRRV